MFAALFKHKRDLSLGHLQKHINPMKWITLEESENLTKAANTRK